MSRESIVYEAVARALPTEGRDFEIDVESGDGGGQRIAIKPLSPLGVALAPFLLEEVRKDLDAYVVSPGARIPFAGSVEEL